MTQSPSETLAAYCRELGTRARTASLELQDLSTQVKNRWLSMGAESLRSSRSSILEANARDLEMAPSYGLTSSAIDRLTLTPDRLDLIERSLLEIAALPDPVGEIIGGSRRPNGLQIQKVRVPIGVLFFIFESRPNVTADAAAIAIKSGNAIILRGGKEAYHSSYAIFQALERSAVQAGLPNHALQMVNTQDRQAVGELLKLPREIDLVIPRGGESLVRRVTEEATMPVLKHFDGNCHVYVDRFADLDLALKVVVNSKTQRMGVCNAAESLVVHSQIAPEFLRSLQAALIPHQIELRGDARAILNLPNIRAASEDDWGREYLGPILSIKTVDSLDQAIAHINRYGSKHTDAIITKDLASARCFAARVDSAVVMINASTRFNDGGQFGLGAEIGISTDKLHARGPCGLVELTTYKYIVFGEGQIRE